jgi:hypothetical protein
MSYWIFLFEERQLAVWAHHSLLAGRRWGKLLRAGRFTELLLIWRIVHSFDLSAAVEANQ